MKASKHMWQRCLSALLVLVMVAAFILPNIHVSAADTNADLWIDPVNGSDTNDGTTENTALKTIQAAKSLAATLSESKDVVVILKSGTYDATETIVFGEGIPVRTVIPLLTRPHPVQPPSSPAVPVWRAGRCTMQTRTFM